MVTVRKESVVVAFTIRFGWGHMTNTELKLMMALETGASAISKVSKTLAAIHLIDCLLELIRMV